MKTQITDLNELLQVTGGRRTRSISRTDLLARQSSTLESGIYNSSISGSSTSTSTASVTSSVSSDGSSVSIVTTGSGSGSGSTSL